MNCPYCGTPGFRTSRPRFADLPHIVLMRYPVRCRSCRERFYVSFLNALNANRVHRLRHKEALDAQNAASNTPK